MYFFLLFKYKLVLPVSRRCLRGCRHRKLECSTAQHLVERDPRPLPILLFYSLALLLVYVFVAGDREPFSISLYSNVSTHLLPKTPMDAQASRESSDNVPEWSKGLCLGRNIFVCASSNLAVVTFCPDDATLRSPRCVCAPRRPIVSLISAIPEAVSDFLDRWKSHYETTDGFCGS